MQESRKIVAETQVYHIPIKKLPQVGQEPVEAVESRHISPDGVHNTRIFAQSKDIS